MKRQNGITLIALVISIIVMLILAGVSINAIVGENGVLTQAQNAKLTSEEAARREALEMILFDYNSSEFLNDTNGITDYLKKLKEYGQIEDYAFLGQLMVKYDGYFYSLVKENEYYKIGSQMSTNLGENAAGGNYIVTTENADETGNLQFTEGSTYAIIDNISAEGFNFVIPSAKGDSNKAVTIYLSEDMKIDNKDYPGRSAIELEDGAILNLYIYGNVEVNSSLGIDGEVGNQNGAKGGTGASAGIHVSKNSTLNLYGTGTLKAYGGNAGKGTDSANIYGGGGGGGAGAGIGGNGGDGGNGSTTQKGHILDHKSDDPATNTNCGWDGKNGEDCGIIKISNSLTVYAYGGAGASAGNGVSSSGGGAGGYPAAGIGGGGAGGRWWKSL